MSIVKREVFYDNSGGYARFWDFALVQTSLGAMVEPFVPGSPKPPDSDVENFDPTDEIARIDSISAKPRDIEKRFLFGEEQSLHGGDLRPRVGP